MRQKQESTPTYTSLRGRQSVSSSLIARLKRLHDETDGLSAIETIALGAIIALFFVVILNVMQTRGYDIIADQMNDNLDCQIGLWRGTSGSCGSAIHRIDSDGTTPLIGTSANDNLSEAVVGETDEYSYLQYLSESIKCDLETLNGALGMTGFIGDIVGILSLPIELAPPLYKYYKELSFWEKLSIGTNIPLLLTKWFMHEMSEVLDQLPPDIAVQVFEALQDDPKIIMQVLFPDAVEAYEHGEFCKLKGIIAYEGITSIVVPVKIFRVASKLDSMMPDELLRLANRLLVGRRAKQLLNGKPGYNISPEEWFHKYDTLGRDGTFVTDRKAIADILSNFDQKGSTINITKDQAKQLEKALGLQENSLNSGFRISRIDNIADRAPASPIIGNDLFLGSGEGLPGGGPEFTLNPPISTEGGEGIIQITVHVMEN